MALYLVSYDIREKNRDYRQLISRLEQYGALEVLFSVWLLPHSEGSARTIAEDLSRFVLDDDGILVQEVGSDAAWRNLKIGPNAMDIIRGNATF